MSNLTPDLTPYERKLAAALLDLAADDFSHHGCNDLDLSEHGNQADADALNLAIERHNDSEEEYEPGCRWQQDYRVMRYLANRLRGQAAPPIPAPPNAL